MKSSRTRACRTAGACLLAAAISTACVRPAEDRAERDREVGRAANQGLSVEILRGLAAVRQLSPQQITLWGSAPNFEIRIAVDQPRVVALEVRNCLPAAELRPVSGGVSVTSLASDLPTQKRYELTLPAGTSRLQLAAPDSATRGPFVFALLSDVQEAIDDVQDVFQRINAEADVRFLLGAGDLTERGSTGELVRYQRELETLASYSPLGNHEIGRSHPLPSLFRTLQLKFLRARRGVTLLDRPAPRSNRGYDGRTWSTRPDDVHVSPENRADPIGLRNEP